MLMIRLQRIGRTNDPAFRVLVLEKTASPKAGTYTDLLGTYNPKTKNFTIAEDRLKDWISKGAQVSPSLQNILISKGVLSGKKVPVVSKKNLEKNKAANEEAAAKAAQAEKDAAEAAAAAAAEPAPVAEETPAEEPAPEAAPAEEAPAEAPAEEATPAA